MKFLHYHKRMHLILTIVSFVLCTVIFAGCGSSVADKSDRTFSVSHFNGETLSLRNMTVTNGRNTFYVSGSDIYQYSISQPIVSNVNDIKMLTASDQKLYILQEDKKVIVYDIESKQVSHHGNDIQSIEAIGSNIFLSTGQGLFFCNEAVPEHMVSVSEVICSGTPMGEIDGYFDIYCSSIDGICIYSEGVNDVSGDLNTVSLLTVINRFQPRNLDDYYNQRVPLYYHNECVYAVNCGHINAYGEDGLTFMCTDAKTGKYRGAIENQFIKDAIVYELLQAPDYHGSEWGSSPYAYNFPQEYLLHDCIYATNLNTQQNFVAYQTENNLTRIIGFDTVYVYLFDVQDYTLYKYDSTTEEKIELKKLPQYNDLTFEWCGSLLFIYNGDSVVEIIDV